MTKSILKSLLAGSLIGALLFFTGPFLFLFIFAVLTLKFIFTPFGMGRMMMMRGYGNPGFGKHSFAFAEKMRNMSDEEYASFRNRMSNYNGRCGYYNMEEHQSPKN